MAFGGFGDTPRVDPSLLLCALVAIGGLCFMAYSGLSSLESMGKNSIISTSDAGTSM